MTSAVLARLRIGAVALAAGAACTTARAPASAAASDATRAAPAPLAALLAGCGAAPAGRTGWRYHCGALVAAVSDEFVDAPYELVKAAVGEVADVGAGVGADAPARLALAGEQRDVTRVTVAARTGAKAARARGVVAALPFGEGRWRVAWCVARAEVAPERCDAIVSGLGGTPWRAGAAVPEGRWPPELAGRPVLVPAGCEALADEERGGIVSCSPKEFLRWRRADVRDTGVAELEPAAIAPLADGAALPEAPAPVAAAAKRRPGEEVRSCLVDGVDASCAKTDRESANDVRYRASVTVRGVPLDVECNFQGVAERLPAVCDAVELR